MIKGNDTVIKGNSKDPINRNGRIQNRTTGATSESPQSQPGAPFNTANDPVPFRGGDRKCRGNAGPFGIADSHLARVKPSIELWKIISSRSSRQYQCCCHRIKWNFEYWRDRSAWQSQMTGTVHWSRNRQGSKWMELMASIDAECRDDKSDRAYFGSFRPSCIHVNDRQNHQLEYLITGVYSHVGYFIEGGRLVGLRDNFGQRTPRVFGVVDEEDTSSLPLMIIFPSGENAWKWPGSHVTSKIAITGSDP